MHFLASLEDIFNSILSRFQREEPLIHILYDQLLEMVRILMLRFLVPFAVGDKRGQQFLKVDLSEPSHQLSDDKIIPGTVGKSTRTVALKNVKLEQQKTSFERIRKFCQHVTKYLLTHLPLQQHIVY